MQIDRQIELLGAGVDRPEALVVEEDAVGEAVQHCAFEAELRRALEFVGGRFRDRGRQRSEGGEAVGPAGDERVQPVVDAAGERHSDAGGKLLRRRRAVREHLHVDAGFVHPLEADALEVAQAVRQLGGADRLGATIGLDQLIVPVVFLDGDDRTMRLAKHVSSSPASHATPSVACESIASSTGAERRLRVC